MKRRRDAPALVLMSMAASAFSQSPPPNPPAQTHLTALHTFTGGLDGAAPYAALVEGEDGVFYGTTSYGGDRGGGTVFKVTSAGTLTTLFTFGEPLDDGEDGSYPVAALIRGADGNFYGSTTQSGLLNGVGGMGTVFRISPAGVLTTLHAFDGNDGAQPFAPLLLAADGNLYGSTIGAGPDGMGTIFRITLAGQFSILHSLAADGSEGTQMIEPLVQGPAGDFYGTTGSQGFSSPTAINERGGTVFRLSPSGVLTTLKVFSYGGFKPGALAYHPADGAFFGTRYPGAFRITANADFTELHNWQNCSCGTAIGGFPVSPLTLAADGNFYGATHGGGTSNYGALYSMTTAGVITPLHSFDGIAGWGPAAGPIEGRDGRFYGTTGGFGNNHLGSVYKLTLLPPAPATLTATAGVQRVTLQWASARTANNYDVFIGTAPGVFGTTPSLTAVTGNIADLVGLNAGTTYYFRVTAVNEAGRGPASPEASAVPTAPSAPPAPPSSGGGGGAIDALMLAGLIWLLCLRLRLTHPQRNRDSVRG